MMRIHPLLTVLLACAAPAAAQNDVLRPGSAQVTGDRIPERTERFDLYQQDAGMEPIGDVYLTTRVETVDGRQVLSRGEVTLVDGDVVQSDSFSLDRATLAPRFVRESGPAQTISLYFAATAVREVVMGDWGADTTRTELDAPAFAAGSTDLLLAALPLAAGYTAQVAVYHWPGGVETIGVRMEAAEELRIPGGGRAQTWRVAVQGGPGEGTYWMDRESHALVQYLSADGGVRVVRSRGPRSRAREAR
jgi:hypothetical protein